MFTFADKVYKKVSKIPKGRVMTYLGVAKAIGFPGAARAVGNALNKNFCLIKIPCHRVVRSNGEVGGYVKGRKKKEELLKREGIKIKNGRIDLNKYLFNL